MHTMIRCTALTLLLGGLLAPLACSSSVAPAPSTVEDATIPVAALRADFDQLYRQLQAAHYDLYARRTRAEYDALFERMRAELDVPLRRDQVLLHFQRFVAFGRVAHARLDLPFERWASYREGGGTALPLALRINGDRAFVLQESGGSAGIAPGDQVLAVDGQPVLEWMQRLGELVSADTDYLLHAQMEGLLPQLGWLTLGEVDGVELTLAGVDGGTREAWLAARTRAEVTAVEAAAPALARTDMQARDARMLAHGIAYLRPGPFYDNRADAASPWDRSAYRTFIDQAFADFLAAGARDLLLDLRDNPGGDNSFSDLMLAWFADRPFRFSPAFDIRVSDATVASNQARLDSQPVDAGSASADLARLYAGQAPGNHVSYSIPLVPPREGDRFQGRVHVLVNRHTYSNAVGVASIVQDYGFGRVLGEETSDLASTLGAMEHFTLLHTGLSVGYPKARMLRPSGDARPRGVVPDVVLPRPVNDGSEDPVLQRAIEEVVRSRMSEEAKRRDTALILGEEQRG